MVHTKLSPTPVVVDVTTSKSHMGVNQNLSRRVWLRETKDSWDTYSKNGQGWLLVIEDAPQTNEEKEDMREEVSHWQPPSDQNTAKKKEKLTHITTHSWTVCWYSIGTCINTYKHTSRKCTVSGSCKQIQNCMIIATCAQPLDLVVLPMENLWNTKTRIHM